MRRRSGLVATLLSLVVIGSSLVGSSPTGPAFAADPLAEAQAKQREIQEALADQRRELASLRTLSATLDRRLTSAEAELASVTAEYERVAGLLYQVELQIAEVTARLDELRRRISVLDEILVALALEIAEQTEELEVREGLLQEHLRDAYERSRTSLLEVLLAADSFEVVATQVGYLLTVSEQDAALAGEIREIRATLETQRSTMREGRTELAEARDAEAEVAAQLDARQAELQVLTDELSRLKAEAERKRAEQEAALNAALAAQGDIQTQIAANEKAAAAAQALVAKLLAESNVRVSARGFRWPMDAFRITQEWGPTNFILEGPYTFNGVYYPHFHGGIDMTSGCGTRIKAAGAGVVVASGRPLWPWDSGYGVVIDHGGGVMTWYWHLRAQVVVYPGQPVAIGQVIGYEGSTGMSTGCHLHFAVNDHGIWTNPRWYLP